MKATLAFLTLMIIGGQQVSAGLIVDQSTNLGGDTISQDFPDFPAFSTTSFDDFGLGSATDIDIFTVFGSDGGSSAFNVDVVASIYADAGGLPGAILATVSGTQVGADLNFDFGVLILGPGSYWISGSVVRPFGTGGQWFWSDHATAGSESLYLNPGGGFGFGTGFFTHTTLAGSSADNSWTLTGSPVAAVPEPSSLTLVGLGAFGLVAGAIRRRRQVAK